MGVPNRCTRTTISPAHAQEVRDRGFRALKTNILPFADGTLTILRPGLRPHAGLAGAELGQPADCAA